VDTLGIDWNHLETWVFEKYELICGAESGEYNLIIKG